MDKFDLVVIGAGPAGYTGAIRAAQLGMKVACIEKRHTLGGTCLNVGCIPSKALLNSSKHYEEAKNKFPEFGIETTVKLNLTKMLAAKDKVVVDFCKGIEGLLAKNKITRIQGTASIKPNNIITITGSDKEQQDIQAKNILIATGSSHADLPGVEIDEEKIVSSTGALSLKKVPEKMVIIGGGYIGLELGSVWRRLGSEVTVIEHGDQIAAGLDSEIRKEFHKSLTKQGLNFILKSKVIEAKKQGDAVKITIESLEDKSTRSINSDVVLVSVGRRPNTQDLGLEIAGVALDSRGRIEVNARFQTAVENIYAVGDVIKGPMLAHKAEEEAVAAVEIIAGQSGHVNYNLIPSVVYTEPEVASVGMTEDELKQKGTDYKKGKFPFMANSRARSVGTPEGMVKLLCDSKTDQVLGAHIIGPSAGELIAEITAFMEFGASSEDIARTCHSHPTLSEAVKEAALAVDKRTINL